MDNTLNKRPLMFTNRALFSLALPIAVESLLSIMAGLVDSAMVSSCGEAAVSAVSLIDSISLLLIGFFSALSYGGTVIVSQYIGNGNKAAAKEASKQVLYAVTFVSLFVSVLVLPFVSQIINWIYPNLDTAVFEYSKDYFFIIVIGYVPASIGIACSSLLRAQGKSRTAFFHGTIVNMLNVVGNAFFIYVCDMEVAGAALSTTLIRFLYGALGIIFLKNKSLEVPLEKLLHYRPDFSLLKKIFLIGGTNGIETSLFYVGKLVLSSLIASFGTIATAAYAVSFNIFNIAANCICSLGTTLLTVVGQCIGADEKEQARYYTKKLTLVGSIMVLVFYGTIFLLKNKLVLLFGFSEEALRESAYYTGVGALVSIFSIYAHAFIPMSALRAAGDVKFPLVLSLTSMFVFRIGLAFLLAKVFDMGLMSIWLGMGADWLFRAILNIFRVNGNKWLNKKVI